VFAGYARGHVNRGAVRVLVSRGGRTNRPRHIPREPLGEQKTVVSGGGERPKMGGQNEILVLLGKFQKEKVVGVILGDHQFGFSKS